MMRRLFLSSITLFTICALIVACQPKMKPEQDCNFVMSSQIQRVSWKGKLPITLHMHDSIPLQYRESIRIAASQWNYKLQKNLFVILDGVAIQHGPVKDGLNAIYWKQDWETEKASEQGRTTIHWRGDQIQEADVAINAKNNTFSAFGEIAPGKVDLVSLMVHELGHVLGIQHIQGEDSVMAPTLAQNTKRIEPTLIDINSLKCEYIL